MDGSMEYVRRLSNLISFLFVANPTLDSIPQFLALDTFSEFAPTAIILGRIQPNDLTMISESFGFDQDIQNEVLRLASDINNPLRQAMLGDRMIESSAIDKLSSHHHDGEERKNLPAGFEYSLAWPIHYVGAGILYFAKKPTLMPIDELFFLAIGGLLVPQFAHLATLSTTDDDNNSTGPTGVQGKAGLSGIAGLRRNQLSDSPPEQSFELTSRQLVILAELRRGKTNSTIANDLDYSESLIRQETVEIYRKMGVSGRKDLMDTGELAGNYLL